MATTEELQERHHKALQELNDAEQNLASAMLRLNSCQRQVLITRMALTEPSKRFEDLAREAHQNRSNWSGGTSNPANLIERSRRDAALELLAYPPSHIRWS